MRRLSTLLLLALLSTPAAAADDPEIPRIEAAIRDYVLAFYEVAPERIDRGVSKQLRKIGYWRQSADESYRELSMSFDELRALAERWNKDAHTDPQAALQEIRVLDHLDMTAVARLDAAWGVDYFHLTKIDGDWKIMNVIWQSHPIKS